VSTRNEKAIFERKIPTEDEFAGELVEWEEVCREWVSLEPFALSGQRQEFIDVIQTKGTRKSKATLTHSPTTAAITTDYRMKIAKPTPVNQQEPNDDANFRIFHIEQIVNVREQNRELEFMVIEKV